MKTKNKRFGWLLVGVFILLASPLFYFDLEQYATWEEFNRHRVFLEDLCRRRPFLTKGIYFLAYLLTASFALPTTTLFTLAGGALFGLVWGVVLVSFASTLGATISFLIVRFFLKDFFHIKFKKNLRIFLEKFTKEGAWYLLTLRLAPVMPFWLTNILMGFTNLPVKTYVLVSQLGMLPATFFYVNAGSQLSRVEGPEDLMSLPLILSFSLLALFPLFVKKLLAHYKGCLSG